MCLPALLARADDRFRTSERRLLFPMSAIEGTPRLNEAAHVRFLTPQEIS
jgi:hypothetical protein